MPKTLEEYRLAVTVDVCRWCNTDITEQSIDTYEHDGGWIVEGFDEKQWLSIQCPSCGYEWALWKIGVPVQ